MSTTAISLMVLAIPFLLLRQSCTSPVTKNPAENYSVCYEPVCYERAALINQSLNASVNPCEDFYSYACGGWMSTHEIPRSKSTIGTFHLLHDQLQYTLRDILESVVIVEENQNITSKLAVAYNTCLAVPEKGDRIDVLRNILNVSGLGHWPITLGDAKPDTKGNCTEILKDLPISTLFLFDIGRSIQNLSSYAIQMSQLSLRMVGRNQLIHPDKGSSPKIINAYKVVIRTTLTLMNRNLSERELTELADVLVDFEGQLANLTTPAERRRNLLAIYHNTTIQELENNFTEVPLRHLLTKEFSKVNITLFGNETVELFALDYYDKLNTFLQNVNCTTLYNYAGLQEALNWAELASEEFRNASFELKKVTSGVAAEKPRWEECVKTVNTLMTEVVSYLYVQRNFSEEAKEEVKDIVSKVAAVFNQTIQESQWMDNDTKITAVDKLAKMGAKIGYPDWLLNVTYLEKLYVYVPRLQLNTSFLEIYYALYRNHWMRTLMKLGQPYNRNSEWSRGAAVVAAYYTPSTNEMVFPAGILQAPFYQRGLPRSLNFGAIGFVIGHEMTHGFDDRGGQFDADGALREWWTNNTRTEFNKRAECFISQYGNITDEKANMTLNGNNTVGENIADNGGLRIVFKAYDTFLQDECQGVDTRLPGLTNLSGKQLFFIADAMMWCSSSTVQRLKLQIQYDVHSPAQYRVNMPMKNFAEFSEVFKCSANSTMNPAQRCTLW